MKVYDKLTRPIYEVKYLSTENAPRYRVIMRLFYINHENIHYWMTKEEVFQALNTTEGFEDYTIEACLADLTQLVSWQNLIAIQDTSSIKTIEDFKNKQYRYQLSDYSVEIERLTLKLESLEVEGSSLEPSLLDRIFYELKDLMSADYNDYKTIHHLFDVLTTDFIRLNENYQDYIKTLNSARADELMKTKTFLVYKDRLILYLREFVIHMQRQGGEVAAFLAGLNKEDIKAIIYAASKYELSIPRLTNDIEFDAIYANYEMKFDNMMRFFLGNGRESEIDRLYDISDDIIRKMTRYASRISEMMTRGSHRKEQYRHIAGLFESCETINEAHQMSAYIFGVEKTLHLNHLPPKTSDDIHDKVYKQKTTPLIFEPHKKMIRKQTIRKPIESNRLEKEKSRAAIEAKIKAQNEKIEALIIDGVIDFETLPVIDEMTRRTLLEWLSVALSHKNLEGKTNMQRTFYVDLTNADKTCVVSCEDGKLTMPCYRIVFKG